LLEPLSYFSSNDNHTEGSDISTNDARRSDDSSNTENISHDTSFNESLEYNSTNESHTDAENINEDCILKRSNRVIRVPKILMDYHHQVNSLSENSPSQTKS